MDRRQNLLGKSLKTPPLKLAITGKTLQVQALPECRSKKRLASPDINRRIVISLKPNRMEKTFTSFLAAGMSFISKKRTSTALIEDLSKKALKKTQPMVQIGDSFELENGSKIYKCMSNPNVNGNSNTFGLPIRATTANNETFVIYKTPKHAVKRSSANTPKFTRNKTISKKLNLIHMLQRSNGIQCKEDEEGMFKYFVGLGNNSDLIHKVMKSRTRWKRIFSEISANFIWTSVKKNNIYDYLGDFEPSEQIVSIISSEYSQVLSQENYCQLIPTKFLNPCKVRVYNRIIENKELTSKKRLFFNMHAYYTSLNINPFTKIPLTYHVLYGSYDNTFKVFSSKFQELKEIGASNIWIVKPGECTNRGIGIRVCRTLQQIIEAVNYYESENERTHIIQKYIENPLLYKGRKFDIRCYALITSFQGNVQCFYYKEGYMRTSSAEFSTANVENRYVHLTNDAVQKYSSNYGKHEAGNKLSYLEFQEYLKVTYTDKDLYRDILPQIKESIRDTVLATYLKLDPDKHLHSFEILGYDFMVDSDFQTWLIEVNTNPCLELSSPYLETLLPKMLDHAFNLTIDQLFPTEVSPNNDFEMIFNEAMAKYKISKETEAKEPNE